MMRWCWIRVLSVACFGSIGLGVIGCSSQTGPGDQPAGEQTPSAEAPPKPPVLESADGLGAGEHADQKPATHSDEKESARVKAEVGVGKKGRRLEDERVARTIVTPAVSLFRTRERMVFEVEIPKAMQMYKALNGKRPETEEEFFEQIIRANQIKLPELPAGQRYVYDPRKGQLMVERPAR
ncbi:MAG: hypothetical protein ACODAD_15985 [Planctomycetota bacterium]